ncbi:MAG: sulfatase [Candidatus Eisenbacteria bacterium]
MSFGLGNILRGTRNGLIAGLAVGFFHFVILATGGMHGMSGLGLILASGARYAGIFSLAAGAFGFGLTLVTGLLPRWLIPSGTFLVAPGVVLAYLYPWILAAGKEGWGMNPGPAGKALGGLVFLAAGLLVIGIPARLFTRRRARPRDGSRDEDHATGSVGPLGVVVLPLVALGLYLLPGLSGRSFSPVDPLVLSGQRLEPLQPRATETFSNGRWNVLLITVAGMRADHLGCYGYTRDATPTIDGLAGQGMRFDRAYCQQPAAGPSVATVLTGLYPQQHGVRRSRGVLDERFRTMAEYFSDAGWRTGGMTANGNLCPELGFGQGFEDYSCENVRADGTTDRAIEWLSVNGLSARPWFLWIDFSDPLAPYAPPPPFDAIFVADGAGSGSHQRSVDLYDGEIRFVDTHIGRLLDWMHETDLSGRTLIILAGSHGESLGEHGIYYGHGSDVYEPAVRVPLVFHAPAIIPTGASPALVGLVDLLPTILGAASLAAPQAVAGRSTLSNVLGMTDFGPREFVVLSAGSRDSRHGAGPILALLHGEAKYVQRITRWGILPRGPRDLWRSYFGYFARTLGDDEYYNLSIDPRERLNLIRSRRGAARLDRRVLESFLDQLGRETEGRIARPLDLSPDARQSLRDLGYLR